MNNDNYYGVNGYGLKSNNNEAPLAPPPPYQYAVSDPNPFPKQNPTSNLTREQMFREITQKYEISNDFANRLQQLQGFKIVFIFDDSGSMNTVLQDSPLNNSNNLFKATRWDELQYFSNIAIEIASLFDPEGSSVYFLNRNPNLIRNVRSQSDLEAMFKNRPQGLTPLPRVLNRVLDDFSTIALNEKKLLIIIATDGEPTDDEGRTAIPQFKNALQRRTQKMFTTVVVCTDDDDSIEYLNKWDRQLPNLDVVDDFRNERKEIRKAKGPQFPFSFGDYVVKSLIGSIDPELDKLDEETECCNLL